jgi:hypothetical protein
MRHGFMLVRASPAGFAEVHVDSPIHWTAFMVPAEQSGVSTPQQQMGQAPLVPAGWRDPGGTDGCGGW